MFESLSLLPPDPLLGLIQRYQQDTNPQKMDLGVGVYRDEKGQTPVLASVKEAEQWLLANEPSKAYVGPLGNVVFLDALGQILFGDAVPDASRLASIQTPGGCGALRVIAELLVKSRRDCRIWVSDPTWANHVPLLGGAGGQHGSVSIISYPYYDFGESRLNFDAMLAALQQAQAGDVVLLHACCHNPAGADLDKDQWLQVIELCAEKALVPLIDAAYQGFGDGLDADAYGVQLAVSRLPEVLVAVSCSKNFGLYRERVGAIYVLAEKPAQAEIISSHLKSITRGIYSMPPSHGASVVATILKSEALDLSWREELDHMRGRIQGVRSHLAGALRTATASARFDFIEREKGMFSFLGLTPEQVALLAEKHSIYMADSSRINLAGINDENLSYLVASLQGILD